MKYTTALLLMFSMIAASVFTGCKDTSERMHSSGTTTMQTTMQDERNDEIERAEVQAEYGIYKTENEKRMMRYERRIQNLKREISNESDMETRERLEMQLEDHEEIHQELKQEMNDFEVSERDDWDEFKNDFSDKMDDFGDSLDNFFSSSSRASNTN